MRMDGWEVLPEGESVTVVGSGRALLPVTVRNNSGVGALARLAVRVEPGEELAAAHLARWILVPGERQHVPAAGSARFLVLVDPPTDVPTGRYVLRLQLVIGAPGSEEATDVVQSLPVLVVAWGIRFAGSVPSSDGIFTIESRVTFEVLGPPGASVRVDAVPEGQGDSAGKFPSEFIIDRPRFELPPSGRDTVHVVVVLGTSEVLFRAVLVDDSTGLIVARSDQVFPVFDVPPDPLGPVEPA